MQYACSLKINSNFLRFWNISFELWCYGLFTLSSCMYEAWCVLWAWFVRL